MNRLRQSLLALLAAVCLAGLPACGEDDVKREAIEAGEKAKKEAGKAKEDVDGQ